MRHPTINQLPTLRRRITRTAQTREDTRDWGEKMSTATLFWVTHDMARVAMDAALDVPEIVDTDRPTHSGLLLFEKPLPPLPIADDKPSWVIAQAATRGDTRRAAMQQLVRAQLPVDGIQWFTIGQVTMISAFSLTGRYHEMGGDPGYRLPIVFLADVFIPSGEAIHLEDEMADRAPEVRAFAALVEAIWVLMMTPTAAKRTLIDAGTGQEPRGYAPPATREVTRVDLRPLRHVPTSPTETDEKGRVYRHRWVVRGHWRNQAHGPGRAQRKLTWVPSYVKGPEGAPLLSTEKVMVWRR